MSWLSILEYSYRHKVSLSTLRRRIKSQGIEHKMDSGRYLIKEDSGSENPDLSSETHMNQESHSDDVMILVQELKKAYGMVLAEKEDMITQLKEEIQTQKKIISFLENEINKENPNMVGNQDIHPQF